MFLQLIDIEKATLRHEVRGERACKRTNKVLEANHSHTQVASCSLFAYSFLKCCEIKVA